MTDSLLTAVVCTRNRAARLELCLRRLLRQSAPRGAYEILVVDNGSTDGTADVCRRFEPDGVRRIEEPVVGLSPARNAGWQAARGAYVGYLDDDGQAEETWIAAAAEVFSTVRPEPAWTGGAIDLDWEVPPPSWLDRPLWECLGHLDYGSPPRWLEPDERLGGGNSFFPRAWLERLGGFDTRLGRQGDALLSGEETQLQRRIEAAGGRLYYRPDIRMRHHVPAERATPSYFYRRYYWGGITDAVIRRTLRAPAAGAVGSPAATPLPSAATRGDPRPAAALVRLLRNAAAAAGFARRDARVRGRIYLAYVAGRLAGVRRRDGESAGEGRP
jgi:glycosyltransferase involved in cell wall biosynthesis